MFPLGLPYGRGFNHDPCMTVNTGDVVEFDTEHGVELEVVERVKP